MLVWPSSFCCLRSTPPSAHRRLCAVPCASVTDMHCPARAHALSSLPTLTAASSKPSCHQLSFTDPASTLSAPALFRLPQRPQLHAPPLHVPFAWTAWHLDMASLRGSTARFLPACLLVQSRLCGTESTRRVGTFHGLGPDTAAATSSAASGSGGGGGGGEAPATNSAGGSSAPAANAATLPASAQEGAPTAAG